MIYFESNKLSARIGISIALILVASLWVAHNTEAQIVNLTSLGSPFSLEAAPKAPRPGSTVTLTAKSFSIDLNRAKISWYVNGELMAEGAGETVLTVKIGKDGTSTNIETVVTTEGGNTYKNSLSIKPTSVDLLWEAESYTPPFYQGKALLGPDSPVTIVAIPNMRRSSGVLIKPEDIIFTWKKGSRVLGSKSGRGKDSLTLKGYPFFKALDVRVELESVDGGLAAAGRVLIPSITPFVLFYESHPTLGVQLEEAQRGSFTLTNDEVTLVAEPYFFGSKARNDANLSYEWSVNNEKIDNPSADKSLITLRPTGGGGSALLSVSIQHLGHILQQAKAGITVDFSGINEQTSI